MGVDFLSKAGKSIERKLDKALVELGTPSLFSANPEYASRTCAAALVAGEKVVEGETLVVRLEDNGIVVAQRGTKTVAQFINADSKLTDALGETVARCGVVCQTLPFSDVVEIRVD